MQIVSLAGRTREKFIEEREKLLAQGATAPPIYTTQEENQDEDKRVYVNMEVFMQKKRNGDF